MISLTWSVVLQCDGGMAGDSSFYLSYFHITWEVDSVVNLICQGTSQWSKTATFLETDFWVAGCGLILWPWWLSSALPTTHLPNTAKLGSSLGGSSWHRVGPVNLSVAGRQAVGERETHKEEPGMTFPKHTNMNLKRHMHTCVHCSQDMEINTDEWTEFFIYIHIYIHRDMVK